MVQIAHQRVIVKHALDTGQHSEMAESLLDALEESLRIFEKQRIFLLSCGALPPGDAATDGVVTKPVAARDYQNWASRKASQASPNQIIDAPARMPRIMYRE